MEVKIEVDTHDSGLGFSLFDTRGPLGPGTKTLPPGGGILTLERLYFRKAAGVPGTLYLVLTVGSSVGASLFANWLYDKIKGRASQVRIDRTEVELEGDKIKKIIVEKFEKRG